MEELTSLVHAMFEHLPWIQSSVNAHYIVIPSQHRLTPVPLAAGLALLGALAWRALRGGSTARALLVSFVVASLLLDVAWQWRLSERLQATRARFAALDSEQRPANGPFAPAFALAAEVAQQVDTLPGRIVIATQDQSMGMATAYHLYPRNVLWRRSGPELPPDSALQNGDYLLLHKPTETRFSRREGVVRGGRWEIGVEEVAVGRAVALLRVTGPVTRQTGP
jgi:hypothetical protein